MLKRQTAKITGRLVYLIGASGSGKDALLSLLRQQLTPSSGIIIAHRYIVRDWQSGNENHVELSAAEYQLRKQHGLFALHWQANATEYAIGNEIHDWLAHGFIVIMNGSRQHLPTAITHYKEVLAPVLIQVDDNILQQRLLRRGRESSQEISARLERSKREFASPSMQQILANCYQISNNYSLADTVQTLQKYLQTLRLNSSS
ncbi:ribose 1,5-bisphosphokinase [Marinomonas agarivorans]|nr:ribose 1,5-bisphosphokinase [Marinomonas agarivorans]